MIFVKALAIGFIVLAVVPFLLYYYTAMITRAVLTVTNNHKRRTLVNTLNQGRGRDK